MDSNDEEDDDDDIAATDDDDGVDEGFEVVAASFAADVLDTGTRVLVTVVGLEKLEPPLTEDRLPTCGEVALGFFMPTKV